MFAVWSLDEICRDFSGIVTAIWLEGRRYRDNYLLSHGSHTSQPAIAKQWSVILSDAVATISRHTSILDTMFTQCAQSVCLSHALPTSDVHQSRKRCKVIAK